MRAHTESETKGSGARGIIVMSAGMKSAGSGWMYNLTNELLIAAGERDARQLRNEAGLREVLDPPNCRNDLRDRGKVERLLAVAAEGRTFTVKSHRAPSRLFKRLRKQGLVRATYIYRDPRDVVVSISERGAEELQRGVSARKSFARFHTIFRSTLVMRLHYLRACRSWMRCPGTHIVRYEDLRADPLREMKRLADFLGVEVPDDVIQSIIDGYHSEEAATKIGTHYRGGGKKRDRMTRRQLAVCNLLFRGHLKKMGYA